jgi:hypothetical protein
MAADAVSPTNPSSRQEVPADSVTMGGIVQTKSPWRQFVIVVACLLASLILGVWWGQTRIVQPAQTARLEIDPRRLDFGEAWEQKEFSWSISLRNPTRYDIFISRLASGCGCATINSAPLSVPAGQTLEVPLTLDLTAGGRSGNDGSRPFSAEIVAIVAGNAPPLKPWTIRGTVRCAYRFEPSRVDFGESLVVGAPIEPRFVMLAPETPLATLSADCDAPDLASVDLRTVAENGELFELRITPAASLKRGSHRFQVLLNGVGAGGDPIPTVSLPVSLRVFNDLEVLPAHLSFGMLVIGGSAEQTVVLTSRRARPFDVVAFSEAREAGLDVKRTAASGGASFRIMQNSIAAGQQSHSIRFHVRYRDDNSADAAEIRVVYYGSHATAQAAVD